MTHANVLDKVTEMPKMDLRRELKSFDSGYEHSLEHWVTVQRMVEESDVIEPVTPAWLYALGVKA